MTMTNFSNVIPESIKTGKFGVEIEMYNITREYAARVVAKYFGRLYTVEHSGGFYDKWICYDRDGRTWTFMSDSSIHDCNGGCEMVTPILGYDDIEDLQEVVRELRHNGAKSDPEHECGVHIHIDAEGYTPTSLKALANTIKSHDQLMLDAIGVDSERREWCKPMNCDFIAEINKKKIATVEQFKRAWYESQGYSVSAEREHYNHTRYCILNLHSLWQNKGIEFRCFQFDNPTAERKGGLHAGQLKAYIQMCLAISYRAKKSTFARRATTNYQIRNPRSAMQTWMSDLGMKGEEFKTAREVFTRNLRAA